MLFFLKFSMHFPDKRHLGELDVERGARGRA